MPAPGSASLKVRALQWLAQREHSRSELHDKLLRLLQRQQRPEAALTIGVAGSEADEDISAAMSPEAAQGEVEVVLAWLEQHGHLSDARFTESRVHARQARYGNRRIQQELRQHGVALATDAQQELVASEFARAWAVWQRKYGAPAGDTAGRLRQMRFLAGRGFSADVVKRVLKQAGRADEADLAA